jgi:hypothetical protein
MNKTGNLKYAGRAFFNGNVYLKTDRWECVDCKTEFIRNPNADKPNCNGVKIDLCPWCRPDSKPWKNGRGI